MAELEQAGEVGVAGARRVDLVHVGLDRPGIHALLPVGVVAVCDQHGNRAAECLPVTHAGADLDRIALDLHPPAPAMPELAPGHVGIDARAIELEPRGQALDDRDEPRPVRLTGGCEAKGRHDGQPYRRVDAAAGSSVPAISRVRAGASWPAAGRPP